MLRSSITIEVRLKNLACETGDSIKPGALTPRRGVVKTSAREAGDRLWSSAPLRGLNFLFARILGLTPVASCCRRLRRLVERLPVNSPPETKRASIPPTKHPIEDRGATNQANRFQWSRNAALNRRATHAALSWCVYFAVSVQVEEAHSVDPLVRI